jgi:hypothetical protein
VPAGPATRVREREWVDAPGRGLENWFTEYAAADPDRARYLGRPHPRTSTIADRDAAQPQVESDMSFLYHFDMPGTDWHQSTRKD